MEMFMRKRILQIILIIMMGFIIHTMPVYANGERTSFGSESYEWELDVSSPVGIYAHATQGMRTVEIYVQYDPTMLAYQSGGELLEEGRIRVSGNAGQTIEYKEMLQFLPLVAGETQVSILESTITDVYGEVHTTASVDVPVSIPLPIDWTLTGLEINGALLEAFSPTTFLYALETDEEELEVVPSPSSLQVEVSNEVLSVGENEVFAIVTSESGQKVRYVLQVTNIEHNASSQGDTVDTVDVVNEVQVMTQGNHTLGVARRNQIFVYVLLMVLVSVLIGLIRLKRQIAKANRHKKSKRKLDKDTQLSEWEEEKTLNHTARMKKVRTKKAVREDKVVIDVNHVVMDFKREKDEATSIKEHVIRTLKRQHSYEMFRALDDISFQVKSGEVVGIIGTNGSGKSTILKIISGVLTPTSGSVHVDTSKIQLLTLGTGFDMELTGHENVYLNGALIGYTKEYIDKKYDEIVAFAELEGFMEEKVRNYSSGMVSRLGFAIATIRDTPEILILDEVLSVGDMFFKKKSIKRIEEMIHGGSTVLIVSHSPSTIREHCTKAVWIEKSKLRAVGVAKDVCNAYEKMTPIGK